MRSSRRCAPRASRASCGYERVPVEELARLRLEHHELVLRSSVATVRRHHAATDHLLRFVRERHAGLRVDSFGPRTAEEFVKYLRRTPVSPNGHPNTPKRRLRDKGVIFAARTGFGWTTTQRNRSR